MVFPHRNYENYSLSMFANIEQWCNEINLAERYCKTITNINEFIGKCEPIDLPAFHPYWSNIVKEKNQERKLELQTKLNKCIIDKSLLKVYFGNTSTIDSIQKYINSL